MTQPANPSESIDYLATNYCVAFIDLLGQRAAMRGSGLVPEIQNESEEHEFKKLLFESVGAIARLQHQANGMLDEALKSNPNSEQRAALNDEQKRIWDESYRASLMTQRWSDGLVFFVNLEDQEIKCHLNGVFHLIAVAGALCFLGLASERPLRGAIEVAWGMELHPGELYGAAIARSYELESSVAQYPRIVVGPEAVRYLQSHALNTSEDTYDEVNRELAKLCLSLLAMDQDGYWIIHYLGESFRKAVTDSQHAELFKPARRFVQQQVSTHRKSGDSKLAFRYINLLSYFEAHVPDAT